MMFKVESSQGQTLLVLVSLGSPDLPSLYESILAKLGSKVLVLGEV